MPAAFDAYAVVDWSANSRPKRGKDSIWCAILSRSADGARLESHNCRTRHDLVELLLARLRGQLAGSRVLLGFDFPFGFPRGLASALDPRGRRPAWRTVWERLAADVHDDERNRNNRFEVAAALNLAISGGHGPFYGRPARAAPSVARSLSTRQRDHFEYPLRSLARLRRTDEGTGSSTPWFLFGGGNSVGGQALVGIPRVLRLREALPDARIWPFETGARLPSRDEARVVLAEVYPSLFFGPRPSSSGPLRGPYARGERMSETDWVGTGVKDEAQVVATAQAFAGYDVRGELEPLFAAPGQDAGALEEEGWILGVS